MLGSTLVGTSSDLRRYGLDSWFCDIQSTTDIMRAITSLYYSHMSIANDIRWSTYKLTADAPCPALTGVPWDVCFEFQCIEDGVASSDY